MILDGPEHGPLQASFYSVILFVSMILALVAQLSDDADLGHHYILCFSLSSLVCAVAQLRLQFTWEWGGYQDGRYVCRYYCLWCGILVMRDCLRLTHTAKCEETVARARATTTSLRQKTHNGPRTYQ